MADLAERLGRATGQIELDQAELARCRDESTHRVALALPADCPAPGCSRAPAGLIVVLEKLSRVLRPEPAHDWLFTPNDSLDHHKPVDLLRTGEFRRVLGAIDAMSEGVFV